MATASDIEERARTLAQAAVLMAGEMNLTPATGDPRRVPVLRVSHGLLPMLGLEPLAGRAFAEADDRPGAPPSVLNGPVRPGAPRSEHERGEQACQTGGSAERSRR